MPFPSGSFRIGLEDRRRERGPENRHGDTEMGRRGDFFSVSPCLPVSVSVVFWSGREADTASANSTLPRSHRSAGMSHAPINQ